MNRRPHQFDDNPFAQLDALLQDPLAFFNTFSTWLHDKAEQQSEELREFPVEEFGPGKPWGATALLIDLAIELWQEGDVPEDQWRRAMAGWLERIQQMVQSYLRP
jgi:hypothetical protein